MAWRIDGEAQGVDLGGYDGSGWQWRVVGDSGESRSVMVRITGSAMAMGDDALGYRAAIARRTQGRTEIGAVLEWPAPPAEIEISSRQIRRSGGDPGPEQNEIDETRKWLEDRGVDVFLTGRGETRDDSGGTLQITHASAHVAVKKTGEILLVGEGISYLDAIRAAKELWEEQGHGVDVGADPAETQTDSKLELSTPGMASPGIPPDEKTADADQATEAETVRLEWDPMPGTGIEGNKIHLLRVTNPKGEVVEIAYGDDAEDTLLEVYEHLMPSWHQGTNDDKKT